MDRPANDPCATEHGSELLALLSADPVRGRVMRMVRSLQLADCWIGAGFVRNAVWDWLHGISPAAIEGDVDVIWFDPSRAEPAEDAALEARLRGLDASVRWSVRNQARMHLRNGDPRYASATDALRFWPETATAVAVRQAGRGAVEWAAPFGLADLFGLIVRPTPEFRGAKQAIFAERVHRKQWLRKWPRLTLVQTSAHDP